MDKVSEKLRLKRPEDGSAGSILDGRPSVLPFLEAGGAVVSRTAERSVSLISRLSDGAAGARMAMSSLADHELRYGHGFIWVPVVMGAGAAYWFLAPANPSLMMTVGMAATLLVVSAVMRVGFMQVLVLLLGLFSAGMVLAAMESHRNATVILDTPVTTDIIGRVERSEVIGGGRTRYTVSVIDTAKPKLRRPPAMVTLVARAAPAPFEAGAVISGRARLSPPSGPALPGLNDFAFSAYFGGIGAVGFFYSRPIARDAALPPDGVLQALKRWLFALRADIGNRIRQLAPGDAGAFAAAIVTDERRAISEETVEALRLSGLAHIVAISGLNMALAAGICFVGLRTVLAAFQGLSQRWPVKKIAACGALIMVTCYYLISGFGVSAQRAYIMMVIMLVAVLLDRPSISLRNVALSALVILVWTPSEIMGPSFQMSFAATAALVAGYGLWAERARSRIREPLPLRHPVVTTAVAGWQFFLGVVMTSLIGSVATAIFSIEHFHRISTYGLAANLAAMPIISFIVMPAGLVAMLLMPLGLEAHFIALMAAGLEWVIAIAKAVAAWGGDTLVGQQAGWFLPLGTTGMLLLALLRTPLRLAGVPFLVAAIAVFFEGAPRPALSLLVSEDGTLVAYRDGGHLLVNRARPSAFVFDQWQRALRLPEPVRPALLEPGPESRLEPGAAVRPPAPGANPPPVAGSNQGERERLSYAVVAAARKRMDEVGGRHFSCEAKAWCGLRIGGTQGKRDTLDAKDPAASSLSSDGIDTLLVVTLEDSRYLGAACDAADLVIAPRVRIDQCRSGALLLSGATLRKTGALEIAFPEGGRSLRDQRNWQIVTSFDGSQRPWSVHRHYDWRLDRYDAGLPTWLVSAMEAKEASAYSMTGHPMAGYPLAGNADNAFPVQPEKLSFAGSDSPDGDMRHSAEIGLSDSDE